MSDSTFGYRATTILFVCGQNLDVDFVSQTLNLSPGVVRHQGETTMPSLANGGQRNFDPRMSWDRWSRTLTNKQLLWDLNQQLEFWLQILSPVRSAFQEFECRGYWSALDCQLVAADACLPSIQFRVSKELQKKIEKLNIDLDFTIYRPAS